MNQPPETRRDFVKKSLAATASISFAGLIRAHGEEGGSTTNTTAWETTAPETTFGSTTSDPWGTTTYDTTCLPRVSMRDSLMGIT